MTLDLFQQFIAAYPDWKLVDRTEGLFVLSVRQYTQQDTFNFNPESPNAIIITPGPTISFYISTVNNLSFDGKILRFTIAGMSYACDGIKQKIGVSH